MGEYNKEVPIVRHHVSHQRKPRRSSLPMAALRISAGIAVVRLAAFCAPQPGKARRAPLRRHEPRAPSGPRSGVTRVFVVGAAAVLVLIGVLGTTASTALASPTALSVYPTATKSTTLPNAAQLITAGGTTGYSGWATAFGAGATGWCQFINSTDPLCAPATTFGTPVPTGQGFLLDSTFLEGQTIAAGTWSGQGNVYARSGMSVSVVMRYFVYHSGGSYTAIGSAPESGSITPNSTYQPVAIPSVSLPATAFNVGDKLYIDAWAHVTANTQTAATNVYFQMSDTSTAGNNSDVIVTPGYSPTSGSTATPTPTSTPTNTPTPTPTRTSTDPVIMAAGDIACDPTSSVFNNGAGTSWDCQEQYTAAELSGVNAVFALGDQQYECATLAQFQQSYAPTWGQQKLITYPAAGNHEYDCNAQNGAGYYTYFGSAASPQDTNCTANCKGYYSFNLGTWHIIVLNSECGQGVGVGLCTAGSPEETWLKADLAANTNQCTLAFWHRPYFTSGPSGGDSMMHDMWADLYNANVDVVLNGHDHDYERFAPQDPNGSADPTHGITEFVVGTGGRYLMSFVGTAANSVVRDNTTFGVLKLTLHSGSYDWQFVPDGKTGSFTDSGTGACH